MSNHSYWYIQKSLDYTDDLNIVNALSNAALL